MFFIFSSLSFAVQADDGGNMIKYRKSTMKAIAGHMTASGLLVTGNIKFKDDLAMHANALAALTTDLVKLFPAGSDFGETDAKEEIWEKQDQFKQAAQKSEKAAAEFAKSIGKGNSDTMINRFKELSETCKGCHKTFRVKK